ncbi:TPM domain-containing protein [Luteimonas sp. MC1895]|uniref:TPM domain-containing protein n=1 Tax=Luteimonas sp. MC1895 TaxID=2819513 RepID=UPI0018F0C9A9|nr:TPM domain-containing protein [Luteimonas sp. MC1895]MBJ6978494.1 TPM domain-containing protein [Luteimonas sp. MC1895]
MPALLLALLLACLAWAPAHAQPLAAIPPLDSPVVDTTGTLEPARRAQLERQALDLQRSKGSQLQVLVVASTRPETIEQYAQRVFDAWRIGREGVDDAVLVLVARDDRRVRIQPGYGLEGAIPDITAGRIIQEYMAPKFRAGDYGGGLVDGTAVLVRLIEGEPLPEPIADHRGPAPAGGGNWLGALFAAFVAATLVRGVFGRAPAALRGLFTGGAAGGVAWLVSAALGLGGAAAVFGFLYGLSRTSGGRYVRHGGWGGFGGGGWGGGGFGGGGGGFGGGGWSGGGGMSGGGGASGSW